MKHEITFNNRRLNDFFIIKDVKNSILPPVNNYSIRLASSPGEYFVRTEFAPRVITVSVEVIANSKAQMNNIVRRAAGVLYSKEPRFLAIDGGRTYKAILDGSTDMENIGYDRQLELTFIAHDPISYGALRHLSVGSGTIINNSGTHESKGIITFTATGGTARIKLNKGNYYDFIEIDNLSYGKYVTVNCAREESTIGNSEVYIDPTGDYFAFPPGNFSMSISGATNVKVKFYERWL